MINAIGLLWNLLRSPMVCQAQGIARECRDSRSTSNWTLLSWIPRVPLPKDFIGEVEVVSNVQDFADVDSESAQTFWGVDPPMHYLSRAIFPSRLAQGCGYGQEITDFLFLTTFFLRRSSILCFVVARDRRF